MTYTITRTSKGDMKELHRGITSYESAHEILVCISQAEKRNKNKVRLGGWQLVINDNAVVYQIKNS